MQQFLVDEDVAALVERLAQPKPFENLSFNDALKRLLQMEKSRSRDKAEDGGDLDRLIAETMAAATKGSKKLPSPSAVEWVASVPELRAKKGLTNWQAICDLLKIDTAGDSARRKLMKWVKLHRPTWPAVPRLH